MATKNPEPTPHRVTNDALSLDALKEQITHLQGELEAERKLTKQLRREKSYNVQQTRDLEQAKATVALNDLRTKLHQERVKDHELLKDSLNRKFDFDLQKVVRQKDAELNKLRSDLRKCQDELEQTREQTNNLNKRGLSGTSARPAFDSERQKLLSDAQELRTTKRHLETELKEITEMDKQKSLELMKIRDHTKTEVIKVQKEADIEIKRLLDELKAKDRLVWQREKENGDRTNYSAATKLLLETPPVSTVTAQLTNGIQDCTCSCQKTETATRNDMENTESATRDSSPSKKDPGGALQQKVKELTKNNKELEEQSTSLALDKTQLQQKIKEMEKKHRATLEKNKRFLEKNIEVTNINRSLEEKIKKLNDDLNKLRSQTEKSKKEHSKLSEQLSTEKVDKKTLFVLREELEELKQQGEEQEKTVTALKMACMEKDRRIELLVHKRRRQKNNKAQQKVVRFILPAKVHFVASGLKETYYGYDEDSESISSEMSSASYLSSSRLSLDTSNDDDEVFEEFTRSDLEQSFQRLMKEHLELEKSYSLLQAKVGQSHIDPQRDNRDTGWLEEKDTLSKTIRLLKDKVKSQDCHQTRLTHRISEIQEQNEELEFRVLELDELNEKLKEEAVDTITITEIPQLTDGGVLQMYALEKGHMEIKLETLKDKLHDLKYSKDGQLDKGDKLVLLQARAMLGIADKKLKDLISAQDLLKERIKKLEAEKAELLSAATGVSTDLILEHEETRQKLEEAQTKITELEESIAKYKEAEAVYKYTEEHNQKAEHRYKHEISGLQRQLSNSQEGREYESELWQENLEKIKKYEKKILELQGQSEPLNERVEILQAENSHLQCGLTQLQCENSQLQLETTQLQDDKVQLHHDNKQLDKQLQLLKTQLHTDRDELVNNLGTKIDEYEKVVSELANKSNALGSEIEAYQIKLKASQLNENTLKTKHSELQKQYKESTERCCHLENEVKNLQDELAKQQSHLESKGEGVLKLRIRIGELSKQVNSLTDQKQVADVKADEFTAANIELSQKVATLHELEQQVDRHESIRVELQNKLDEFQAQTVEQTKKANDLEVKVHSLESTNAGLQKQLDKSQKDAENQIAQLNSQSKALIEKVRALEAKLKDTRENEVQTSDRLSLMEEEKSRRIQDLQAQVDQLEENEARLSETITEMEQVEQALRDEVAEFDSRAETLNTSCGTVTTDDVERLHQSEQRLKAQVDELKPLEKSMKDQISELESRIDEFEQSDADKMITIANYQVTIEELEEKTHELTTREAELMEDTYSMKLENQELQEHIDDLINKDDEDEVKVTEADNLRAKVQTLEEEASELKDRLLRAKLAAMDTLKDSEQVELQDKNTIEALQDHINELEALSVEQDNRIKDLEESEDKILKDLQAKESENKYLHEKIDTLIQGEGKMMEQIEFLEENRLKLDEEIQRLRDLSSASSTPRSVDGELHGKVQLLECREAELLDKTQELEDMNKSLRDRMNQNQSTQFDELKHLREKVEILVNTEERLVDRLGQQEEVEEQLKSEMKEHAEKRKHYEEKCQELQQELNTFRKNAENSAKVEQNLELRTRELEDRERVLRVRINELEKSEMVLRLKLTGAEDVIRQKELAEKHHEEQLISMRASEMEHRDKVAELEKNDLVLRTKLTGLEAQKQDLLETIQMSTQRSQNQNGTDVLIKPTASSQTKTQPTHTGASQKTNLDSSLFPTNIEVLTEMPREEMISRIHELEQMEQFHIEKIKELSNNLSTFRQAVEVVAVTMETDSDIPLMNHKPKLRDQEFEARVQELIKSEVLLKLNNLQLEKKEAILKTQLHEAELMLKQQTREYRAELEDLEAELDHSRKNEAKWRSSMLEGGTLPVPWAHRLKNKLQYGGWGNDSQSLAKIQHLEDLVFELEGSERKLKRHLQETQDTEQDLRERLVRMEHASQPILKFRSLDDQDRFYELMTQVRLLEGSENDLKTKLSQLNDDSVPNLKKRLEQLEKSETSLKRKLDQLEVQEASINFEEEQSPILLDSPEAILRQRIRELERMERHLKQQVMELERDRGELHEIARKDKTLIHELNVQVRELQLSEKNLKDQVNKMEVTENNLHMKIDDMSDRIEDLEDSLKKLQATERHLRAQLQQSEYKETTLSAQLEHAKEDLHNTELKYKRKYSELGMEKDQFVRKIDELTERVGDLDGVEMSLKQKVRNMENCELTFKDKITDLESGDRNNKTRVEELENLNETLSRKIHQLEEEKSSLVFEMSDLEIIRSEHSEESSKLNLTIKALNSTVKEHENKKHNLQKRLDNLSERDVSLEKQLQVYERDTKTLRDQLVKLEHQNKQLRDGTSNACGHEEEIADLKREINQLGSVLQAHEMLKKNHEDAKMQLKDLERQRASGGIKVKDRQVTTMSKSIQVKLADSYTIRHLAPADLFYHLEHKEEFKNALRNLGARHPEAYQDFVKGLQPPEGKRATVVRVTGITDSPTAIPSSYVPPSSTPHHTVSNSIMEDSGINEDFIVARNQTDEKMVAPGTVSAQGGPRKAPANQLVPKDNAPVRKHLIGQLIEAMPLADVSETGATTEAPLWQVVEDHDEERPYWAEVEGGRVDDMTLTVDVWGLTTDESSSEASNAPYQQNMLRSTSSVDSDASAPPLPGSMPPANRPDTPSNDSYYLPSHHGDDSADEASEIDEDDSATPLRMATRAKSAERDSDFSEASFLQNAKRRKGKHLRVVAGSLESIPDSGMGSIRQDEVVKMMQNRIKELENKLKTSQNDSSSLRNKDILLTGSTELKGDNVQLKTSLDQRQKEVTAKTNEIDRLSQELRRWQTDAVSAQDDKYSTERSLKRAEQQLETLRNVEKSHIQLQLDYQQLQSEHQDLKLNQQKLQKSSHDVTVMEKTISDLKAKLVDYDRINLEMQCLERKVKALEDELRRKARGESELTNQNANLRHDVDSLKQQNEYFYSMERDYKTIRSKFDEMAEIKSKALTMITPLRAKVLRFAGKCKTKDELIRRLAADLRRSGEHSESITEADRVTTHAASEDYNRPISPITVQNIHAFEKELRISEVGSVPPAPVRLPPRPTKLPRRTRNTSGGSAASDHSSSGSDLDALLDRDVMNGHHSTATVTVQRSHSTDDLDTLLRGGGKPTIDDYVFNSPPHLSRQPVTQLNNNYLDSAPSRGDKLTARSGVKPAHLQGAVQETDLFIAIKEYNPEQFSSSGRQRLELPLREGDLVKITGAEDSHGYCEGEVRGRVGLVPALYLQRHTVARTPSHTHTNMQPPSSQVNSSPEQILSLHTQLQQSHVPNYSVPSSPHVSGTTTPTHQSSGSPAVLIHPAFVRSTSVPSVQPISPRPVAHPAYHPGNQSQPLLTVSSTPAPGKRCRFLPLKVTCRSRSVVRHSCPKVRGGMQSPPPIDHTQPTRKALPVLGPPEPPSNFRVQRMVGDHSILLSWTPPNMDELARSNSSTVKGYKIYINHKDKQIISSPHMTKALVEKLHLHQGSLTFSIQTIAENGQASRLVDAMYTNNSPGGAVTDGDWTLPGDGDMSSIMSTVPADDRSRRVFLAVYDYKPSEHSPNTRPSQELSFKTGDIVVTYGNVRDDGFYHGKVHGRKGLVPASFIEEIALLRSRGRKNISSSSSLASSLFSPTGSVSGSNRFSLATPDRSRPPSSRSSYSVASSSVKELSSDHTTPATV